MCRLKNKSHLKWSSIRASAFIYKAQQKRKPLKVQARKETSGIKDPPDSARKADIAIFDCCHFFRHKIGRVVLASADKNLCIECDKEGTQGTR